MTSQTMEALALANEIRSKRAAAHREVAALPKTRGRYEVAGLLMDPPDWLLSERVGKVLTWPRQTGVAYSHRALGKVAADRGFIVRSDVRVKCLNHSQREALARVLRDGAPDA